MSRRLAMVDKHRHKAYCVGEHIIYAGKPYVVESVSMTQVVLVHTDGKFVSYINVVNNPHVSVIDLNYTLRYPLELLTGEQVDKNLKEENW